MLVFLFISYHILRKLPKGMNCVDDEICVTK